MQEIPLAKNTDAEDVVWGLQTAETLWKRGERIDALVWLRRAAQAAGDANDDDRALELARYAAELTEWMANNEETNPTPLRIPSHLGDEPPVEVDVMLPQGAPTVAPAPGVSTTLVPAHPTIRTMDEATEVFPLIDVNEGRPSATSVLPAEKVHAGMFDPWAESRAAASPPPPPRHASVVDTDEEEVVTSVRPAALSRPDPTPPPQVVVASAPPPKPASVDTAPLPPPPAKAPPRPSAGSLKPPTPPKAPPPLPPRARPPVPPTKPATVTAPPTPPAPPPASELADEPELISIPPSALEVQEVVSVAPPPPVPSAPTEPPVQPTAPQVVDEAPVQPSAVIEATTESVVSAREVAVEPPAAPSAFVEPAAPAIAAEAPAEPAKPALDLEGVDAFADLPDDARAAFAAAATLHSLAEGEEIGSFALAYVLSGSFDVAATVVDAPAVRLAGGAVLRARGTTDENVPIRLICAAGSGVIATWSDTSVEEAFRSIPWVEDDLRAAADRVQTLVGITIGPLGERLDASIREAIVGRLTMRPLIAGEVVVKAGASVPGLLLVGIGELELVKGDQVVGTVSSGDFLFPSEVLGAGSAPSTARAGAGGALVMFGDRRIAQELLVTCPPLLELFAGM